MIDVLNYCSRCGKKFTNLRITTTLGIYVERLKETGIWEEIPNLDQVSKDILCEDCFEKLSNALETMNITSSEEEKRRIEEHQKDPLKTKKSKEKNLEALKTEKIYILEKELANAKEEMRAEIEILGEDKNVQSKKLDKIYLRKTDLEYQIKELKKTCNVKDDFDVLDLIEIKEDCTYADEI